MKQHDKSRRWQHWHHLFSILDVWILTLQWQFSLRTVNKACFYPTGAHILSGNCYETRALSELFPDWKEQGVSYSDIFISIITFLEHSVHKS